MNPLYIVQELSARCYAGCAGCFRSFVKGPRDGDVTRDIFEAGLRDVPRGTMYLPQFHGEGLLHPDFAHFIERYEQCGMRVSIPVSALAGERYIPLLVGEGTPVYVLIVSVDGACDYTHSVRRGKIPLSRAERFVDDALAARGSRTTPWIAVRWVEGGQSEIEFEQYLRRWLFERGVDMVLRSRMFQYGSPYNSPTSIATEKCHALREGAPVILFNGDVLLCERVEDRERWVIGNVLQETVPHILASGARERATEGYPECSACRYCSAAYLLTGLQGELQLRHPQGEKDSAPIYFHSDHSQSFYSLTRHWSGINWRLR